MPPVTVSIVVSLIYGDGLVNEAVNGAAEGGGAVWAAAVKVAVAVAPVASRIVNVHWPGLMTVILHKPLGRPILSSFPGVYITIAGLLMVIQ